MPIKLVRPRTADAKSKELKEHYFIDPIVVAGLDRSGAEEIVEKERLKYAQHRDQMLQAQKTAQSLGNRDLAKFFREEAKDDLKFYRGACLLLPQFTDEYSKDCKYVEPYDMPIELAYQLDYLLSIATL